MRLRAVDHVVSPANALLDADLTPLSFLHQALTRNEFAKLLGEDHVAVLVLVIEVLFTVQNLLLKLLNELASLLLLAGIDHGEEVDT